MWDLIKISFLGVLAFAQPLSAAADTGGVVAITTPLQREHLCEEEQRLAVPWISWAIENRTHCVIQSQSVADRNACLNTARQQLIELEREHAAIYLNQIRSLKPDHPVMKTLLNRLRDNRDLAALAIDTDAEPSQLISMRKEACLHSSKR